MQRLTSVQPGLCLQVVRQSVPETHFHIVFYLGCTMQVTFKAGDVTPIYVSVPRPKRSAPRRQLAPLRCLPEKVSKRAGVLCTARFASHSMLQFQEAATASHRTLYRIAPHQKAQKLTT